MKRFVVVAVVVAFTFTACGGEPEPASTSGQGVSTPQPQVTSEKNPDLLPIIAEAALDPCPPNASNPDAAIPGLPSLSFPCLGHGPDVDLSRLRGKPLVLNVWASWCPPCIAEMPILTAAAADLRGQVQFLGVNIQDQDASALRMLTDFDADFPSVVDQAGTVRGALAISGPPVTFFVDERGVIVGRHNGALPNTAYFDALMSEYLGVER